MNLKAIAGTMMTLFLITAAFSVIPISADPGPIRIGILAPMVIPQGYQQWIAAQMVTDEINTGAYPWHGPGGVKVADGDYRQIELVGPEDSGAGSPEPTSETGAAAAEALITAGIDYAVGTFRSEGALGAQSVFNLHHKLFFCDSGSNEILLPLFDPANYDEYKYTFRIMPPNETILITSVIASLACYFIPQILAPLYGFPTGPDGALQVKFATVMEKALWTEMMTAMCTDPAIYPGKFACPPPIGDGVCHANYTGPGGYLPSPTETDFKEIVGGIKAGPDGVEGTGDEARLVIHIFSASTPGVAFIKEMALQEVPAVSIGINVAAQEVGFWDLTDGACEYDTTLSVLGTRTPISPEWLHFWDAFMASSYNPDGEEPMYTAGGVYSSILMIADAIERAGSTDTDAVIDALERVHESVDKYGTPQYGFKSGLGIIRFTDSPLGPGKGHDLYCDKYALTPYWPPVYIDPDTGVPYGYSRAWMAQWQADYDGEGNLIYAGREVVWPMFYGPGVYLPFWKPYRLPITMSPLITDINHDAVTDIDDVMTAALAFGAYPGHERWDATADINGPEGVPDDLVDIDDIIMIAIEFGDWIETPIKWPPGPQVHR